MLDLSLSYWRRILWRLSSVLRWYVRSFPISRGRGVVLRRLVIPLLPKVGFFRVLMPSGYEIRVGYREHIGICYAIYGDFERQERETLHKHIQCGTTAIDVGANIGIYTLDLSKAVGEFGSVISIEPWTANVRRLKEAIACNGIANVRIWECAAGSESRLVAMHGGRDPAYVTSKPPHNENWYPEVHTKMQRTLDELWINAGCPPVSAVKIDVEGSELEVLQGARRLLTKCHPTLLCEANSTDQSHRLTRFLCELGYRSCRPSGFEPWNFLYVHEATSDLDVEL